MTIVIALNVNDGMVLAADSASTMISVDANGNTGVSTVYNHANKIVNLHKGLPIGGVTWGLGSIGPLSTSTLMKNLRTRLAGKSAAHQDWTVDPEEYTIEGVARRACEYIFEECYVPAFVDHQGSRSEMGFVVGGYSSGQDTAEEYRILVKSDGTCDGPQPLLPEGEHSGLVWHGEVAAIQRLVLGFDGRLGSVLSDKLGVPENQIDGAIEVIRGNLGAQMFLPGMPIQDAIDLAVFLADLTAKFARFTPGPPTVGGTIEDEARGLQVGAAKALLHARSQSGGGTSMTDPNVLLNSQTASDLSRQSQKREAMTTASQRVERTETLPGSSFVRRENQISKVEIDEKKMKKALRELS